MIPFWIVCCHVMTVSTVILIQIAKYVTVTLSKMDIVMMESTEMVPVLNVIRIALDQTALNLVPATTDFVIMDLMEMERAKAALLAILESIVLNFVPVLMVFVTAACKEMEHVLSVMETIMVKIVIHYVIVVLEFVIVESMETDPAHIHLLQILHPLQTQDQPQLPEQIQTQDQLVI